MCDNGFKSLGSPKIFDGLRYRKWMREVWESFKLYAQRMKEESREDPDPTLSLEKNDVPYVRRITSTQERTGFTTKVTECLKALYKRPIEGKHVPFQRYVIIPEEDEETGNDQQLPSYSRAFAQDTRRSKCIDMLSNKINTRFSRLF